ncbi:hypothetical protein BCV72DRAFT_30317 [Rhizopus microsporus var. microsporus]|uniref:RING-type domain-containing protein n=1 Tax=Rhizopus microsporus var. microsporus TaxID=86635 RepID=A0A1X0REB8_RHIZD|nr:hypothetical protein BCV72DRAFT_30317 [Rhizopus microsporus var. microsporus]
MQVTHVVYSFICDILTTMISSCPKQDRHMNDKDHAVIYDWIQLFQQDMTETMLASVYKPMMKDLFKFEKHHITHYSSSKQYQHHYSYQISLLFLKSALRPEIWKQFQFAHISFFPSMNCSVCHSSICLHCGYDAHASLTCDENMRKLIKNNKNLPNEVKKTIVWTLQNSRQCPNCSIMINRDEGCNKVDCSYCGYSFCWCCRSSWSEGCGFYRCSTDKNSNQSMTGYDNSAQAEVGVPDMKNIQERIRLNRQPPIAFN